ncbi:hypothetical protein K525DRAFT_289859 [Schizophyllum commune Loenen D]|nr:hypothetical protein K525DRAFT_289859 [Schizophyllum commune Loenen D]
MTSPHLGMLNEPLLVLPEQEMDGYIASFGAHLAALKSHRNLTVPAVCMPSELLSEIFFFVAFSGRPLLRGRLQSWSYLMLVCRRWRAIGVSTPILWSRMHVGMRARDPAHLIIPSPHHRIRCKNHPLTMTIDLERDSTGQATRTLLPVLIPHFDQFASLELAGTEHCLQHFLESYTASRRIGLQMLSLILQPAGDPGPFVLSQEATQNVVPCLRTLFLQNVAVQWDALRNLQSLTMYFYSFIESDAPQPITLSVLLSMLRRSPDLRKLPLLTRNGSDMLDGRTELVHLPCLNHLYLTAHPLLCAAMLASVHMPSWSDIVIQSSGAPENEYQSLPDAVGGLFSRPGAPAMRCVRLTSSPMVLFTTDSPADEGQPNGIPEGSGARLSITAYPPGDEEMQGRLLVRLLSAVPSQSITHLICGAGSLLLQRNICRLVLCALPSLQWISCRGRLDDHQIWFDALRDWAGSNADHRLRSFRWRVSKDLQDVLDACAGGGRAVRRLVISSEWQSHNMMAVITLKNLVTHAREMGVKVGMEPDTVYCEILFDTPEAE